MYEASPSALTHSVIWVHSNYTLSWFNFSCIHLEIYLLFIYIYVFRCSGLMECKFLKDSYGCMNFLSVCFNVIFWTLLLLTYIFAVFLFVSLAKVLSNFLNKQFSLKKKKQFILFSYMASQLGFPVPPLLPVPPPHSLSSSISLQKREASQG